MLTVSYNNYLQNYKGTLIPDAVAFASAVVEATAYVEQQTALRAIEDVSPFSERLICAVCAVAEVVYQSSRDGITPIVSSESVGNHSKTYAVAVRKPAEIESEKRRRVRLYLAGTGLLYRGLR